MTDPTPDPAADPSPTPRLDGCSLGLFIGTLAAMLKLRPDGRREPFEFRLTRWGRKWDPLVGKN